MHLDFLGLVEVEVALEHRLVRHVSLAHEHRRHFESLRFALQRLNTFKGHQITASATQFGAENAPLPVYTIDANPVSRVSLGWFRVAQTGTCPGRYE